MRRASCFVCLCLIALVGAGFSQDFTELSKLPSRSKIQALLQSGDPRQVAWGAHYALIANDQAVAPALLSLADGWQAADVTGNGDNSGPSAAEFDRRDAMAAVLDALIQMNAFVPVGTLRNLAEDFPNYVAILLSRLPLGESQALSWDLYREEPHSQGAYNLQYVSAALLAEAPPPGFAADLLSSVRISATINVTAPGVGGGLGSGVCGGAYGCTLEEPRAGWPEFGIYVILENKTSDSFAIASDLHPVFAARSTTTHYRNDRCENFSIVVLGPEQRRRLLANMLGIRSDEIDWETELHDEIQFLSGPQFYQDLFRWTAAQQDDYRVTAAALVAANLMTASEQEESLPEIDLRFVDQRGPGYAPLARAEGLPSRVVWEEK